MKVKTLSALAGLGGALICSGAADAAYLGVGLQSQTVVASGAARTVYRLYAVFDNPNDYLVGGAGSEQLGPISFQSLNALGTGPGSNFFNPAGGGQTAPDAEIIKKLPAAQWDTFVTVGLAIDNGTDGVGLSPGFPNITGNNWTQPNAAWFTEGAQEQGRAGGPNGVTGTFFGSGQSPTGLLTGTGVLLAQLTVNAGGNVAGTLAVVVDLAGGVAGGSNIPNQTFNSVPAPGALALLGLAGLVGTRRRRA
jgi:MYXO-CTERM domain-containing protein